MNKKMLVPMLLAGMSLAGGYQIFANVNQLPTVYVEGDRTHGGSSAYAPLGEVADQVAGVGLIGKKDVMELPFTGMTVSEKSLQYFGSPQKAITDMLTLNPSVRDSSTSLYNDVSIRGFNINGHGMYINGIPGLLDQQKSNDIFVAQATIISGPNIGIAGTPLSSANAGTIDFQSKKAMVKPNMDLTLSYQGGSSFRGIVDIGSRYQDNKYGIRVMADVLGGDTAIKGENIKQRDLFINLDQKSEDSRTNLLVGYNYVDNHASPYSFNLTDGVTKMLKAPRANRTYKPKWSYNEYDNWIMALNHEQKLTENVTAFINAGYHKEDWFGYIDGSPKILNDKGDFSITLTNWPLKLIKRYIGVGIKGQFILGETKHDYMVNVDKNYENYWIGQGKEFGTKGSYTVTGNLYQDNSWESPVITHYVPNKAVDEEITGWHIVDSISSMDDTWSLLVGFHGHKITEMRSKQKDRNYSAVSPTYALNYRLTPETTVYISHSENFGGGRKVPTDNDYANEGELLAPNKTKQNEVGLKYKAEGLLHTISIYNLEQANYNDVMIDGKKYYKENGKQEGKGFEYTVSGAVTNQLDIIGGLNYMDVKQALSGKPANGVADWSATLGMVYKPSEAWRVISRVQYMGEAPIFNGKFKVPSHFVFDLGCTYDTKVSDTSLTVQAMVHNLFGKDYWMPVSSNSSSMRLGSPRTLSVTATMHF